MHIAISAPERAAECLTQQQLTQAAQALKTEGFVVLENAIDHEPLGSVRK